MNKEEIMKLLENKIEELKDIDDNIDIIFDMLFEYKNHPDFNEIFNYIYDKLNIKSDFVEVNPEVKKLDEALSISADYLKNEQYQEVVDILIKHQNTIDILENTSSIDLDKFEIGCFINEIEKELFFYLVSNPNKDIHLIDSAVHDYYSQLSLAYMFVNDQKNEEKCYKKILKYNPVSNQALIGMAYVSFLEGNFLTSIEYIKEFFKYAVSYNLIFEAYQILTHIYIEYGKYDYAAVFAYIGLWFATEDLQLDFMLETYKKYQNEIDFDIENIEEIKKFVSKEDIIIAPDEKVLDVLYTLLLELKNDNERYDDYYELAQIILKLTSDEELQNEIDDMEGKFN